jgi:hypothetical protein
VSRHLAQRSDAEGARRQHVLHLAHAQRLGAGDAGVADPAVYGQREDQHADAGPRHQRRDGDVEQDAGKGQQHVDDAHQHLVEPAAEISGEHPEQHADDQTQHHHRRRQPEQQAGAVADLRQQIAAVLIGAKQVRQRRSLEQMVEILSAGRAL